jgi:nanoRNase/pAp phosphatase (c-di-AMP/oligoRNAs hydrolase)
VATQVIDRLGEGADIRSTVSGHFDLVVLVDTNSKYQLGPRLEQALTDPRHTLIIDHHEDNPNICLVAQNLLVRADKSSTCEMIADLFDGDDVSMDQGTANLLLAGMIFDTRRFMYGHVSAIRTGLKLIERGADYDHCLRSLIVRPERSERIARLKAAGRMQVHEIGQWVVATSKVSAYEASACRALVELGADVAVVGGSPSKDVVRLSSRSTNEFHNDTGVSLSADVMEKLGELIEGAGGGHANAAGAKGKKNLDRALAKSVELIREAIDAKRDDSTPDS